MEFRCPFDQTPLAYLKVLNCATDGRAPCCLQCGTLFVFNQYKQLRPGPRAQLVKLQNRRALQMATTELGLPMKISRRTRSTILIAKLMDETGKSAGEIAIVSRYADQNTEEGFYWVGRELPSRILAAIKLDPDKRIKYRGSWYQVREKYSNARVREKYLEIITRFCDPSHKKEVYLYEHSQRNFYEQRGEFVMAMVQCANETFPVPIPAILIPSGLYFMDETVYGNAAAQHGLPWINPYEAMVFHDSDAPRFKSFRKRSLLNILGYSVNASTGPSIAARRNLLKALIDGGIMSSYDIRKHLWTLIDINKNSMSMIEAVKEWQDDIYFLMEYAAKEHESIWVNAFWSQRDGLVPVAPEE